MRAVGASRREGYDAFISCSHSGERAVARALERTLWTFGRKWYLSISKTPSDTLGAGERATSHYGWVCLV